MSESWKLTAFAKKPVVQDALLAHEELDNWDFDLVISGREIAEDKPQDWVLEAWYHSPPGDEEMDAIKGLFEGKAPNVVIEKLEDQDWLTLSQEGVDPIRSGRFYVRTPDYPKDACGKTIDLIIPASQAFGTGQHETTAGCLKILDTMRSNGAAPRNIADIGTGTGLLAFAAMKLWPNALATASDIDPVCTQVVEDNAQLNSMKLGARRGELAMVIADGMDNELLQMRGPYDLLLANILAGPLIELAPDFAQAVAPRGNLVLAGLLTEQEPKVRRAYRKAGFRLSARLINGDWSILWLRKKP